MSPVLLSLRKWVRKCASILSSALTFLVFLFLDLLDTLLCPIFRFLDEFIDGQSFSCYCHNVVQKQGSNVSRDGDFEISETLYGRKNVFRQMGFLGFARKCNNSKENVSGGGDLMSRWSDCGCKTCVDWSKDGDPKLHVVIREPSRAINNDSYENPTENVIFLHGFLSSSSFWTASVFPNLSETAKHNYKLFAVDLLGFGKSPKPRDCLYTIGDHIYMIEKTIIEPLRLKSFHLVAHSMGCIIASALAAKYPTIVKSITLVAAPYFPCSASEASLIAFERLAGKALWPPILFGSSLMSWYEHLGRCVCFLVCRNHRLWEKILKLLTGGRNLHFMVMDLSAHTHYSAWHSMHNVICGGAKRMDKYLETLAKSKVKTWVVQGKNDGVVPLECSKSIEMKIPNAKVDVIANANHGSVVLDSKFEFSKKLEHHLCLSH